MNLFNLVLPSLWVVKGKLPETDGIYRCRLNQNGRIDICSVEFSKGEFKTDSEVIAWQM